MFSLCAPNELDLSAKHLRTGYASLACILQQMRRYFPRIAPRRTRREPTRRLFPGRARILRRRGARSGSRRKARFERVKESSVGQTSEWRNREMLNIEAVKSGKVKSGERTRRVADSSARRVPLAGESRIFVVCTAVMRPYRRFLIHLDALMPAGHSGAAGVLKVCFQDYI